MSDIGPRAKTTYHCAGCPALKIESWVFYGENDEVDRGVDAECHAFNPKKNISS